jgi:hypothetical protein
MRPRKVGPERGKLEAENPSSLLKFANFSHVGQPGDLKAVWPDRNALVPRNGLRIGLPG